MVWIIWEIMGDFIIIVIVIVIVIVIMVFIFCWGAEGFRTQGAKAAFKLATWRMI